NPMKPEVMGPELPRLSPHFDVREVMDVAYRFVSTDEWKEFLQDVFVGRQTGESPTLADIAMLTFLVRTLFGGVYDCREAPEDLMRECLVQTFDVLHAEGILSAEECTAVTE